MTVRIEVRDEVIERLNVAPPSGVPEATKRRWIPGRRVTEPGIAIFFNTEDVSQTGGTRSAVNNRNLAIVAQCRVAVDAPDDIDDALEPLLSHVDNTINVPKLSSPSLIMSATAIKITWEAGEAEKVYAIATAVYIVEYQTKRGDVDKRS